MAITTRPTLHAALLDKAPETQKIGEYLQSLYPAMDVRTFGHPADLDLAVHQSNMMRIDLLICDEVGTLDGGKQIRKWRHQFPSMRAIFFSGHATETDARRLLDADVIDQYLPKNKSAKLSEVVGALMSQIQPVSLPDFNEFRDHCANRSVPFAIPMVEGTLALDTFESEARSGSTFGNHFINFWNSPLLTKFRTFVLSPAWTPEPSAPCFLGDRTDATGAPVWLNAWDLYWEVAMQTPLGKRFGGAWSRRHLSGAER